MLSPVIIEPRNSNYRNSTPAYTDLLPVYTGSYEITTLDGELPRLKSTSRAEGSYSCISGHASVINGAFNSKTQAVF